MNKAILPKENDIETALRCSTTFVGIHIIDVYNWAQFIYEQMQLHKKNEKGRRYGSFVIIFAFSLPIKSASSNGTLIESQLIIMPSIRYLKTLTRILDCIRLQQIRRMLFASRPSKNYPPRKIS